MHGPMNIKKGQRKMFMLKYVLGNKGCSIKRVL